MLKIIGATLAAVAGLAPGYGLAVEQPLQPDEAAAIAVTAGANASEIENTSWGAAISVDELVSAVIERNPSFEEAKAAAEAAAHRVKPAGALDDPMLTYAVAPATLSDSNLDPGHRVELSQTVPWPGKLGARQEAARQEAAAMESGVGIRRLDIVASAKAAYAEWYFIHEAIRLNRENQEIVEDLRAITEGHVSAGQGLQQDILRAETESALLTDQFLALQAEKVGVQARINALLNREPDAFIPPPESFQAAPLPALSLLIAAAERRHPRLLQLERFADARAADVDYARKDFYPDFRLAGGYNSLWDSNDKRYTVGVSINIPLNRGRLRSELSARRAEENRARWRLEDERAQILNGVSAVYADAQRAAQSIAVYREQLVPLADETLDASLLEYQNRVGDFLNVITAERDKLRTEQSLYRLQADYIRKLAELESVVGQPLAELPLADAPAQQDDEVNHE